MSENEIIEANRLIAVFMGGVFETNLPFAYTKSGWFCTPANNHMSIAQDHDLKYHLLWEWIMPVAKKCRFETNILNEEFSNLDSAIQNSLCNCEISNVFDTVIDFIKWYNAQSFS